MMTSSTSYFDRLSASLIMTEYLNFRIDEGELFNKLPVALLSRSGQCLFLALGTTISSVQ